MIQIEEGKSANKLIIGKKYEITLEVGSRLVFVTAYDEFNQFMCFNLRIRSRENVPLRFGLVTVSQKRYLNFDVCECRSRIEPTAAN